MDLHDYLPIPDLEHCKSLLCIQPHPDDNEIGAAAAIAKLVQNGCKVTYLTALDGRIGTTDPSLDPAELVEIRRNEVESAGGLLGVTSFHYLDYEDGSFVPEKELCHSIVGVIRKVQPQMVLTVDPFLPYECHPDHRLVGMAAAEACLFSMFPHFYSVGEDMSSEPWHVEAAAFYNTAYPNTFIDVSETWTLKSQAVLAHKSQFDPQSFQAIGLYLDLKSRQYGAKKGCEHAEGFKVLSTDIMHVFTDAIQY